uniref:Uncharacterized protein n=1 Tax=Arundo donax TaxID=35708 RepID=A0A0A9C9W5_ARUDO
MGRFTFSGITHRQSSPPLGGSVFFLSELNQSSSSPFLDYKSYVYSLTWFCGVTFELYLSVK